MQLAFVVSGRVEEVRGAVVRNIIRSDIDACTSLLSVLSLLRSALLVLDHDQLPPLSA